MLNFSRDDFLVMTVEAETRRISHEREHRLFLFVGGQVAGGTPHHDGGVLHFSRSELFMTAQTILLLGRYDGFTEREKNENKQTDQYRDLHSSIILYKLTS